MLFNFQQAQFGRGRPGGGWNPTRLTTPLLAWFNDASSVTDAGSGACSQWNDITGNAYHATQSTGGSRPTITSGDQAGRRVLSFDGTDDRLAILGAGIGIFANVSAGFMFGVWRKGTATGSRHVFNWSTNTAGGGSSRLTLMAGDASLDSQPGTGGRRLDADSFARATHASALNNQWVMALGVLDYSARTVTIYVNGNSGTQTTGAWSGGGNTSNTNSAGAGIGSVPNSTGFFDGKIGELFCGSSVPSATEIDKLFGYAAHRWALTGNLPAGHPYKLIPP